MVSESISPLDDLPAKDRLGMLHGQRAENIYVILSEDGSTLVKDPGLNRPWSSPNKKIAEHIAKGIKGKCTVVTLDVAIKSVVSHPKNLPGWLPKGFKLPDM